MEENMSKDLNVASHKSDVDAFSAAIINKSKGAMALETNEDSSYDSDFETDETNTSHADISRTPSNTISHPNASRCSSTGLSSTHHDVSRTVSDTLGEEFAEYVNTDAASLAQNDVDKVTQFSTSKSVDDDATILSSKSSNYSSRVEFGLKLGYSERLVQTALQKLGPNPSQNELLGELIKLGAQTSRSIESVTTTTVNDISTSSHLSNQENSPVQLRNIIIDGSNVAMSHGNKEIFSCRGIKICVDWFLSRGHKEIIVFVPKWRKESSRPDHPISEQEILYELERERLLVFTPSRLVGGKRLVCYDDRYVLKLAAETEGIVVSNDNYRDLVQESSDFRKVVEERILMYSFVNDRFMPPDDPLGRSGPTLDSFLRLQNDASPKCPYGKKCTYGNKCKFHHPERGNMPHKSVADRLTEHAQKQIQARSVPSVGNDLKTHSLPLYDSPTSGIRKMPLGRTRSAAPAPPPIDPHYHTNIASHFNRAQLDHQTAVNKSLDRLPIGRNRTDPPPKSHSIENITSGLKEMNFSGHSPVSNQVSFTQQGNHWGSVMNQEMATWMYMENQEPAEARNMHRKLQRQLTLNPAYDPRLFRMHGCNQNLAPQPIRNQWSEHTAVSRISSAPAACAAWPPAAAPGASASEPRLHPLPPHNLQSSWAWTPPQTSHHEARSHMHYHLSSIFPEEQVQQAMSLFPEETNPQKICAAILSMFPKA